MFGQEATSLYHKVKLVCFSMKHSTTPCHAALILSGGFILQMIAGGITHSYGVFLADFVQEFNITHSDAAWPGSIEAFVVYESGGSLSKIYNYTYLPHSYINRPFKFKL